MRTIPTHESNAGNPAEEQTGYPVPSELIARLSDINARLEAAGIDSPNFRQMPEQLDQACRRDGPVYEAAGRYAQTYISRFTDVAERARHSLTDGKDSFASPLAMVADTLRADLDTELVPRGAYKRRIDGHVITIGKTLGDMLDEKVRHFEDEVTVDKVMADYAAGAVNKADEYADRMEEALDQLDPHEQPTTRVGRLLSKVAMGPQTEAERAQKEELARIDAESDDLSYADLGVYETARARAVEAVCELFGTDVVSSPDVLQSAHINNDWYRDVEIDDRQVRVGPVSPTAWLKKQVYGVIDRFILEDDGWAEFRQQIQDLEQEMIEEQRQRAREDAQRANQQRASRTKHDSASPRSSSSQIEIDVARLAKNVKRFDKSGFDEELRAMMYAYREANGELPSDLKMLLRFAMKSLHPDGNDDVSPETVARQRQWAQLWNAERDKK